MESISLLFIIFKFAGLIVAPALTAIITIVRFLGVKKKNGSVIYRKREFDPGAITGTVMLVMAFGFLMVRSKNVSDLLKYSLIFVGISSTWILVFTAGLMKGIYEKMIIYPRYSCEWNEIEDVLYLDSTIRFIHKKKGAFDFEVPKPEFEKVRESIQNRLVIRPYCRP